MVYTQSFPSGHAMLSAVVYLTLGVLLARTQAEPKVKAYLLVLAIALTLTVGISRVYLGVHWPTDVLAGWRVLGAVVVGGYHLVAKQGQSRATLSQRCYSR